MNLVDGADRLEVVRLPLRIVRRAERLNARNGLVGERSRAGAVGADEQQPPARHEVHEAAEGQRHRREVRVDVGVVELDVVDDGDVGQVLQELGGLVEERAVVLVAFDHEVAALPDAIAGSVLAEVARDAADEHARIEAAMGQQPAGQ